MPSNFIYSNFSSGMDLFTDRSKLPDGVYPLLINGRSRFGKIKPIKKPLLIDQGLPSAANAGYNYQGLYGVSNISIVFANGRAWVRDWNQGSAGQFIPLGGALQLSEGAEQIYLEVVPASTINFHRVNSDGTPSGDISFTSALISPSPVVALVQDGVSQPWVIPTDGAARLTQNYSQWQNNADNREYVPIGKQMVFVDDKLYIASPDGRQIYQSVSGRPLDYMVIIDKDGNKLDEPSGNASNISNRVFYESITCLAQVSSDTGAGFYVGSPRNSFIVVSDPTDIIYGEPRFQNKYIASYGPLNDFSFISDINGDSAFIDSYSVKSFNSILQFRNAGKNSPFSLQVSKLFENITQSGITAASQFDNYSIFSLMTTYGPAVLWYDNLRQCWESVDIYDNVVGYIRQFAEVLGSNGNRVLLFLTSAGLVYQWGGSSDTATCRFYIGDWNSGDPKTEMQMGVVKAIFDEPASSGTITASLFVDNQLQTQAIISKVIDQSFTKTANGTLTIPFGDNINRSVNNPVFDFTRSNGGYKAGVMFEWNFDASLTFVSVDRIEQVTMDNPIKEQQSGYLHNKRSLGLA